MFSSFERLTNPITDYVIRSPDQETATTEPVNPEVVSSPESIEIPSKKPTSEQPILKQSSEQTPPDQPTSEQHTEPIPEHNSEQTLENT
ncbi:hypothetical protein A2U01_0073091, partial [Trifolium medium]|nr:hypothetical protein [Trifolium medium]